MHAYQSFDLPKNYKDIVHAKDNYDTLEEALDVAFDDDSYMNKAVGRSQGVKVVQLLRARDVLPPDLRAGCTEDELDEIEIEESRTISGSNGYRYSARDGNSQHAGLLAFQSESEERAALAYAEKLRLQAEKRARRAIRAKVAVAVERDEPSAHEALKRKLQEEKGRRIAQEIKDAIQTRLRDGFFHRGGGAEIAGERYDAFHEFFSDDIHYRSQIGSPSLARWAQITPRDARCGTDKAVLMRTATKLFALDAPYVEMSKTRLCYLVVDFDSVWASYEDFHAALVAILGPDRMPNIVTGRTNRSGKFCRPHAFWLLKPESCVWNDLPRTIIDENGVEQHLGDPQCKKLPVQKFWRTLRSLVNLLIPLGADPAMTNIFRPKNPLSTFWQTIVVQDDRWYELGDFASIPGYTQRPDEHSMFERAAALAAQTAGASPKLSNAVWRTVGTVIDPLVAEILKTRDFPSGFLDAKRAGRLSAWFDDRVRPLVEPELAMCDDSEEAGAALNAVIKRRCEFAARYVNHHLAKPRRYRGRDRVAIAEAGLETAKDRQAQSGRVTAKVRSHQKVWIVCQELSVRLQRDGYLHKTETIKDTAFARPSFMYDRWSTLMSMLDLVEVSHNRWEAREARVSPGFRDGAYKIKSKTSLGEKINPSDLPTVDVVVVEHGVEAPQSGNPASHTVDRPITVDVDHLERGIRPAVTVNHASVGLGVDPPWSDDRPVNGVDYQRSVDHRPAYADDVVLTGKSLCGASMLESGAVVIRPHAATLH